MWVRKDNELSFTASDIEAMPEIPVGNWLLKFHPQKGFYLEKSSDFKLPPKIYGNAEQLATRYLNTFANQNGNLGILLSGLKGTGKSVTAKITAARSNRPVIIISEPFDGDGFKSFLNNISQEVVVFIDEFEKVYYDHQLQNSFLTILDGVFEGKKLFIFTSNEKDRINTYMLNRPGRVHYLEEYHSLPEDIINDVVDDNLKNLDEKAELIDVLGILSDVTMDMLISLIREMNLYNENARESIKYLNLKPDRTTFNCVLFQNGTELGGAKISFHPLTRPTFNVEIYMKDASLYKRPEDVESEGSTSAQGEDGDFLEQLASKGRRNDDRYSDWVNFEIDTEAMNIEKKEDGIIYHGENGLRFVFTKHIPYVYNW